MNSTNNDMIENLKQMMGEKQVFLIADYACYAGIVAAYCLHKHCKNFSFYAVNSKTHICVCRNGGKKWDYFQMVSGN